MLGTRARPYLAARRFYPAPKATATAVDMANPRIDRRTHWRNVYRTKRVDSASWYQPHLNVSPQLLAQAGLSARSRLIDVGAGASTLVHDLLDKGLRDISVLDVSQEALPLVTGSVSANRVTWYAGDVLELALPPGYFDFWHDPAVLHFTLRPGRCPHLRPHCCRRAHHRRACGFRTQDPGRRRPSDGSRRVPWIL